MKTLLKIREDRKEEFLDFVKRINKKADKLGLPSISLIFSEREIVPDKINDPTGKRGLMLILLPVLVEGEEPVLAGWRFVAALDHVIEDRAIIDTAASDGEELKSANIVRCKPGEEIDSKWRTARSNCDHCRLVRNRLKTYLLRHESGKMVQVGSTCIGDFLGCGLNPEAAAIYQEELFELQSRNWSEESSGGSGPKAIETDKALAATAAHIRLYGWKSRAQAKNDFRVIPTASQVLGWLFFRSRYASEEERKRWTEAIPIEADTEKAKKAREWALKSIPASDYEHNLKTIASMEIVGIDHLGLATSLVSAYDRAIGEELKRKMAATNSQHFGELKKRGVWEGTIARIKTIDGRYGTTWIVGFQIDGNEAVWFSSNPVEFQIGDKVKISGSVKAHDEYKGVKQTVLTRCKLEKIG